MHLASLTLRPLLLQVWQVITVRKLELAFLWWSPLRDPWFNPVAPAFSIYYLYPVIRQQNKRGLFLILSQSYIEG